MEALIKHQDKKAEWRANGHGEYQEIPEEKEFFNVTRKSDNCVIQVSIINGKIFTFRRDFDLGVVCKIIGGLSCSIFLYC